MKELPEETQREIRQICTYYSEFGEGTAGYDLSEEQFQKLFDLFSSLLLQAEERGRDYGYQRRGGELLIMMDEAEKKGMTFNRFIAAYAKLVDLSAPNSSKKYANH